MRNSTPQKKINNTDKALDHLLDMSERVPTSPELVSSILTSALLDKAAPTPASPSLAANIRARVSELTKSDTTSNVVSFQAAIQSKKTATAPQKWVWPSAAGGLMAASLMLGIWTGSNGSFDQLIAVPLDLAGIETTTNTTDEFSVFEAIDGFGSNASLL